MEEKWQTLKHNGPAFPPEYEYSQYEVKIKNNTVVFGPLSEEMAYAWTTKLETEYVQDKVFQKNFLGDWVETMPSMIRELVLSANFPEDFDFSNIWKDIQNKKQENKNCTKEEKEAKKKEKEVLKEKHGYAELNGKKTTLGAFIVEPPGLFMGRGKHPLRGRWKPRIHPEDITINTSEEAPKPPEGHKWANVVTNKNAMWTCLWTERVSGIYKGVIFSAHSFVNQTQDMKKFEKAIKLAKNMDKVNDFINKKLLSRDPLTREIATVCKLISELSIRVGDEKKVERADTVGATTLRKEHIKIDGTTLTLDFLGKDSIRYYNQVKLDVNTIRNIEEFSKEKNPKDMIFPNVTSGEVKEFLSLVIPGITAKNFRTAHGSTLLAQELQKNPIDPNLKPNKKLEVFTEANLQVAIKLNHQSAVSKNYDNSLQKMKDKLNELKRQLKDLEKGSKIEINKGKEKRDSKIAYAKNRYKGQQANDPIKKARQTFKNLKERYDKKIATLKERIDTLNSKIKIKEQTKGIALGTSKLSYADPRLAISWCKDNDVELNKIYTSTAQQKFEWAMDVDKDFYKQYPEIENDINNI